MLINNQLDIAYQKLKQSKNAKLELLDC